jgi:putative ABC transport system permease protein
MGVVLSFIFDNSRWYFTIIMLLVMFIFAAWDSYRGLKFKPKRVFINNLLALFTGAIVPLCILFYIILAIQNHPPCPDDLQPSLISSGWYNPMYIIPISAMVISNTMSGISICLNYFGNDLKLRKNEVEAKLSLGASPMIATEEIQKKSIRAGLIPTINNLMVLGIVKLPGLMTGQILGGVAPSEAIKYQLIVMYIISASTAISLFLLVKLVNKSIFNRREQLVDTG